METTNEPGKENKPDGLPAQEQPQTIQFQIPFQVPLQQPLTNQQLAPEAPRELPNVVALVNGVNESTKEGNSSESQVPSQIILIASAILTIVGLFALNSDSTRKISWQVGTLLLLAIFGLGVALLAGVLHFTSERRFWYGNRERGIFALNMLAGIQNDADRDRAAALATNQMNNNSSRLAFYTQAISFTIGVIALLILIVAEVISKIHN